MSDPTDITADNLLAGELQLYDYYSPSLQAGSYAIEVTQTLEGIADVDELRTVQEFLVTAPQYTLSPAQIINQHPPAGSTGRYGEVLPHIVLKDPMLAWERTMGDPTEKIPWLALLVFEEAELAATTDPLLKYDVATRTFTSTVTALQALILTEAERQALPDGKIKKILTTSTPPEEDLGKNPVCQYIRMSAATFQAIAPRLDELPYLSHVRKINTGERPLLGLNEHGLFSVTMANRFAHAPAPGGDALPLTNIAHLVSLEGLERYLTDQPLPEEFGEVALITLASWTFRAMPNHAEDFRGLALNLIAQEKPVPDVLDPARLWLRLPPVFKSAQVAAEPAAAEANRRLAQGYAPLPYHTRSGENTLAWYRGPLAPLRPALASPAEPYFTSDAALLYNDAFGVFDVSLAAAWEVGREAALADSAFGPRLLDFRRRAHQLVDSLHHRLTSDHFTPTQLNEVDASTTVQDMFLAQLVPQLAQDLGTAIEAAPTQDAPVPPVAGTSTDAKIDAQAILAEPSVQAQIKAVVKDDLAPLAEWLGRLLLLYPVPFDNLVPDERMLPPESLRFFYLDENWLEAALDGALSLGLDSSKQTAFSKATKGLVYEAGQEALAVLRDQLQGRATGPHPKPPEVISGFLLRSALVSGWPNLVVRAKDEDDKMLKILRLDHLAPNVLLCLFDGVPDNVELSEPAESLGFGVNDNGGAVLRLIQKNDSQRVGHQLQSAEAYGMRDPTSRVLNIRPKDSAGLVQQLIKSLKKQDAVVPGDSLGSAAFSIQLIRSPEAVVFTSQ
jgi:hypothetical protein